MDGKQVRGLAKIVKLVYDKKFSKYNQESAWTTRPLRRGQIHYAALDAVSVLDILKKYRAQGGHDIEDVSNHSE
jgi:ribonuclease D